MAKLTLNVDETVVAKAKRFAKQRGVSVSEMVERYLSAVVTPANEHADAPVLRSVRGILRKANVEDYKRRLAAKYR